MPKKNGVESTIQELEGFAVKVIYPKGGAAKTNGARSAGRVAPYTYARAARNTFTVGRWREHRFKQLYPALDVEVLFANGSQAGSRCKLATVRKSYGE